MLSVFKAFVLALSTQAVFATVEIAEGDKNSLPMVSSVLAQESYPGTASGIALAESEAATLPTCHDPTQFSLYKNFRAYPKVVATPCNKGGGGIQ